MKHLTVDDVDKVIIACENTLVELYKLRDAGKNVEVAIKCTETNLKQACDLMCQLQRLSDRRSS